MIVIASKLTIFVQGSPRNTVDQEAVSSFTGGSSVWAHPPKDCIERWKDI